MTNLTTHVLDTSKGKPASGMKLKLYKVTDNKLDEIASGITNIDGRLDKSLFEKKYYIGIYVLLFFVGDYFDNNNLELPKIKFLDEVIIRFGISDETHYHVPLLISPFGYSTYRGS